ncbi:MAG: hypothetical protein GF309_12835 [Candidatus Lokiarchaeota archaeon]|nr:hypothetical protein [Candidatus Lokiarchaeota archaeon]
MPVHSFFRILGWGRSQVKAKIIWAGGIGRVHYPAESSYAFKIGQSRCQSIIQIISYYNLNIS